MSLMIEQHENLQSVLTAPGRSAEIPESEDVYGWLIGSWKLRVLHYRGQDLLDLDLCGEVHFGWVLEGRAIQDVWIVPRRSARSAGSNKTNNMFGTTLRVWDEAIRAWRITWTNPVSGHRQEQIGRRIGVDIVQIGARPDGTPTRWRFTEISPDRFHWIGESLQSDGRTWLLEGEFLAERIQP